MNAYVEGERNARLAVEPVSREETDDRRDLTERTGHGEEGRHTLEGPMPKPYPKIDAPDTEDLDGLQREIDPE
jgi:hypothetical protein